MSVLRHRVQIPSDSKYYVALSDLSGHIFTLSNNTAFVAHPSISQSTNTKAGTVMKDMGKRLRVADVATLSAGVAMVKVKFFGPNFDANFSMADAYVGINSDPSVATASSAIARLG